MVSVTNIGDHKARVCDCGSVHYNLLESGAIECAGCHTKFGQWSEIEAGTYYCGNCRVIENIDANPTCSDCGSADWIKN